MKALERVLPLATLAPRVARRARSMLPRRRRPAILMYHRIARDAFDPWGLAVAPERFAAQLDWIAKNRRVLPLTEFVQRHRSGDLPKDAAAITFDDGYACTAAVATPILQQFGLSATIFLPAELIEKGSLFWWDELQEIVLGADTYPLKVDGQTFVLGEKRNDDRVWKPGAPPRTPRQSAFRNLWAALHPRSPGDLDQAMADLRSQAPPAAAPDRMKRPMTAAEVRCASAAGVEFGSHALTHPSLPHLSRQEKARQIHESVQRCAALSGHMPRAFAYPYGDLDEGSARIVEEAGFECACATQDRCVEADSEVYALPRIAVGDWNPRRLARALAMR